MKTVYVAKSKTYKRLHDQEADQFVKGGKGQYVSKSEWKKNVRDYKVDQALADNPTPTQEDKPAKKKKPSKTP